MGSIFCITVRFLQPYSHGRSDDEGPEWPPSPLRLMQALVAAAAGRWNQRIRLEHGNQAIRWLETRPPPQIVAAPAVPSSRPYRLYVPDNINYKTVASWGGDHSAGMARSRVEKDVLPSIIDGEAVHYLYSLPALHADCREFTDVLTGAARSITHLGWGVDMAAGDAGLITDEQATQLSGLRWNPSPGGGTHLRVPKPGTLDDIVRKHTDFLNRVGDGLRLVPPLRVFDVVRYRSQHESTRHPFEVFSLRRLDRSWFRYPHRRLMHVAGMARHAAIKAMEAFPPSDISEPARWVEAFVAGHRNGAIDHRQFSYVPLPSIGHEHADCGIRRVMIVAPFGEDGNLQHLAEQLDGWQLEREGGGDAPILQRLRGDGVTWPYVATSLSWATVTPIVLPGHDDHKPAKTRKLLQTALQQSGIEQPCEFTWGAAPNFRNSLSAYKRDRQGRQIGYFLPGHLRRFTVVHARLKFDSPVTGPIVIGAGRHCGFGLFAAVDVGV